MAEGISASINLPHLTEEVLKATVCCVPACPPWMAAATAVCRGCACMHHPMRTWGAAHSRLAQKFPKCHRPAALPGVRGGF